MISAPELNMTPQETVDALDRYIIGQTDAKKAVAGQPELAKQKLHVGFRGWSMLLL